MDGLLSPTRIPFAHLDIHGDRVALVTPDGDLTYADLAERVRDTAGRFGLGRKLVLVAAANDLASLTAYLAALSGGHPVLLAPGDNPQAVDALASAYDPDVVVSQGDITESRATSAHELHPELALLLPTSGSTGSPKLVRLSHDNLSSNAESIATSLDIRDTDRAMTSLPMHYCYGLSVVHSHLLRGASLVLTRNSVVDACFWNTFRTVEATTFAGVPYTFDLLDRVGFEDMSLPSLRYITQAGGRMAPEQIRRYAEMGRRHGWQLVVMYGQTEATARMAYLPPEAAFTHPTAIGIPVPGGRFDLEPLDAGQPDEGELVYRGPNVMLGYAEHPADLATGRTIDALRTGDIARRVGDGLYEIVGRRSRFLKLFGLRIDLDQVERTLLNDGVRAVCTGDDTGLVAAVDNHTDTDGVRALIRHHVGLPASRVRVCAFAELPRLANGKPDYVGILRHAQPPNDTAPADRTIHDLFATVLRCPHVDDDATFVSLGGDSLSYVEMSIALEERLGFLPPDWPTTPVDELVVASTPSRRWQRVETNVVLRAVAIVLVVGTHAGLFAVPGGAHVLLAVAGFNFARFQLARADTRRMWNSIGRIAAPAVALTAVLMIVTDDYGTANLFLVNDYFGALHWDARWHYWYIEVLVQLLAVLALAFSVPAVRRWEHRHGFPFAVTLAIAGLVVRFDIVGIGDPVPFPRPHSVLWVFALGWAAARARTTAHKLALSTLALLAVPGFFGDPAREAVVAAGMLLLVWVPTITMVRPLHRLAGTIASASLYVYLTHFHVYPPLAEHVSPAAATAAAIGVGIVSSSLASRLCERSSRAVRAFSARTSANGSSIGATRWCASTTS